MKSKNISLILLLIWCHLTYAQNEPFAVVSATKENVFYIGLDNPIQVAVANENLKNIRVSIDKGKIEGSNGRYIVSVSSEGVVRIKVTIVKSNKEIDAGLFPFRAHKLPDPVIEVGGLGNGGSFQKAVLKVQKGLIADLRGFDIDAKFEIKSYKVMLINKDHTFFSDRIEGPYFSKEITDNFSKIENGDYFLIYNVVCKGPDGFERNLAPAVFTITE